MRKNDLVASSVSKRGKDFKRKIRNIKNFLKFPKNTKDE